MQEIKHFKKQVIMMSTPTPLQLDQHSLLLIQIKIITQAVMNKIEMMILVAEEDLHQHQQQEMLRIIQDHHRLDMED